MPEKTRTSPIEKSIKSTDNYLKLQPYTADACSGRSLIVESCETEDPGLNLMGSWNVLLLILNGCPLAGFSTDQKLSHSIRHPIGTPLINLLWFTLKNRFRLEASASADSRFHQIQYHSTFSQPSNFHTNLNF
jgi:hypothetical protein